MSALIDQAWREPEAFARRTGRKVVGYLGLGVPEGLIAAAGMTPLLLTGRGLTETPLTWRYMEPTFDPSVRAVFQRLLAGDYDDLAAILIPRAADSAQRLYYYLCELKRSGTDDRIPEPILVDLQLGPHASSRAYSERALGELARRLAEISGLSPQAPFPELPAPSRERFLALRRERRIAGPDGLKCLFASRVLPAEGWSEEVERLAAASPLPGRPVVLAGSALDQTTLHEAAEAAGALVVGDYHGLGEPLLGPAGRTLAEIAAAAVDALTPRSFMRTPEAVVDFAKAAGAEAMIYAYYAEEEALTWDFPAERRAVEAAGLKVLLLEDQPYRIDSEAARARIAAFLGRSA